MNKVLQRKDIVRALRLTWDSLDSHLDAAAGLEHPLPCCNEAVGKRPFHQKCVREYAEIIKTLSELL